MASNQNNMQQYILTRYMMGIKQYWSKYDDWTVFSRDALPMPLEEANEIAFRLNGRINVEPIDSTDDYKPGETPWR